MNNVIFNDNILFFINIENNILYILLLFNLFYYISFHLFNYLYYLYLSYIITAGAFGI